MIFVKRFLLMIQFLTTIPLPVTLDVKEEDFGKGLVFAPVIGLLLGGILAGLYFILSRVFETYITIIFVFIAYIVLTGGLHLDGLGDTFDGIFSNRSRERILEIMRDSRVGTNAVLAIICIVLSDLALLAGLGPDNLPKILLLMPMAGRVGSLVGAGISVYARSNGGLGKSFIDSCGIKEVVAGLALYFLLSYALAGVAGIWTAIPTAVIPFLSTKFLTRKIGGATGDILGAVCELNQVFFLAASYIVCVVCK